MAVCWTHTCASMPQRMIRCRRRSFTVRMNSSEPQHENAIFSIGGTGVPACVASTISLQIGPRPLMYCAVTSVGSFSTPVAPISFWIAPTSSARRGMRFVSFSCTSITTSAEFCGVNRQSDIGIYLATDGHEWTRIIRIRFVWVRSFDNALAVKNTACVVAGLIDRIATSKGEVDTEQLYHKARGACVII